MCLFGGGITVVIAINCPFFLDISRTCCLKCNSFEFLALVLSLVVSFFGEMLKYCFSTLCDDQYRLPLCVIIAFCRTIVLFVCRSTSEVTT